MEWHKNMTEYAFLCFLPLWACHCWFSRCGMSSRTRLPLPVCQVKFVICWHVQTIIQWPVWPVNKTAGEDVTSTSLNWRCQTTGLQSLKGFLGKLWLVWRRRELFSHVLIGVGEGRGKCYMAWGAEGCETGIVGQLIPLHSVGRWSSVAGDLPNWCRVVSWKPVSSFERVFWKVPSYSEVFFYQGLFLLCVWDHCRVGQWSCCHMVDQIRINYSIK